MEAFFLDLQNQGFFNSAVFPFFSFQKQVLILSIEISLLFQSFSKQTVLLNDEIRKTEKWCNGGHGKNPWDPREKNGKTNG